MPKMPTVKKVVSDIAPAELPTVEIRCVGSPKGPITAADARRVLGWENEDEYRRRRSKENPSADPASFRFVTELDIAKGIAKIKTPHNVLLKDINGVRVWCRNNDHNRPFDEAWARRNAQEILMKNWAGPAAWPGETVNGDTIKITKSNTVMDAQHRLIGVILAEEEWSHPEKGKRWRHSDYWPPEEWPNGPVLESIVVTGISDSWKVAQTCDNTRPRTLSDTIYTSEIFSKLPPRKRDKASGVLSDAIEFLWKRLARGGKGENKVYKTHTGHHGWLANHMRLVKCAEHVFQEDEEDPRDDRAGNSISIFRTPIPGEFPTKLGKSSDGLVPSGLKLGACAGMLFLQGCSDSDPQEYRKHVNPTQRMLDWGQWDKAKEFWSLVGNGTGPEWNALRAAIVTVNEGIVKLSENGEDLDEMSSASLIVERNVIISKAWHLFKNGEKITKNKVLPQYEETTRPDGKTVARILIDRSNFGGIDLGDAVKEVRGSSPGKKSLEDVKTKAGDSKAKRVHGDKPSELQQRINDKLSKYPDKVMVYQNPNNKRYFVYQDHADLLVGIGIEGVESMDDYETMGVRAASMSAEIVEQVITKLTSSGHAVAKVREGKDGEDAVSYYTPRRKGG